MLSELHGPVEDVLVPVLLKGLKNLLSVGMGYITLNRSASTLSGGEAQKVKLAKALGCSLTDIIYILDEPTAGMHPHDIHRIQRIIRDLVLRGNTVITISHNRDIIRAVLDVADSDAYAYLCAGIPRVDIITARKDGKLIVNVINNTEYYFDDKGFGYGEIAPLADVTVSIKCANEPRSVRDLRGNSLSYTRVAGRIEVKLARVDIHEIITVDEE